MKKLALRPEDIYFDLVFRNKKQAIKYVGKLMMIKGFVKKPYIKSMIRRDKETSVAIGNGLAIPHAEQESMQYIEQPGMVFIKLAKPLK
jgi:PTS system mannitol-specific IIA component